jgi:hypothetical protein
MEKEEKIKKVKDTIRDFIHVLSFIQWLTSIIWGSGITIIVRWILMPEISLLGSIILGLLLIIAIAIFMVIANMLILKKREIAQTREIEEQRRKDEREPVKESFKRGLNKFVSCWEDGKESLLERSQKREKELKDKLFDIGKELKKEVKENKKLLPQPIVGKAEDIAGGIINLSNKIRPAVETRRIQTQEYKVGEKLIEKAKELIEELQQDVGDDKK